MALPDGNRRPAGVLWDQREAITERAKNHDNRPLSDGPREAGERSKRCGPQGDDNLVRESLGRPRSGAGVRFLDI